MIRAFEVAEARLPDDRHARRAARRKDRLIQTRVPRDLESTLKREARRRRLTVSHLIRNILEDTFQLVDDVVGGVDEIVSDSVELARRVGRDARRMAGAVRDAVAEVDATEHEHESREEAASASAEAAMPEPPAQSTSPPAQDPLAHVFAWNSVIANHATVCARCAAAIERGAGAFLGSSDEATHARTWLCQACGESL